MAEGVSGGIELPVVFGQEYRVKLGRSFTFPKQNAFHTIKYDFKPQSVDPTKPGRLKVADGDEVNVSLPVVQAESADDVTQFRGPKKNCNKECILIINTQTGEAILEKITNTVQLKAIRDGRKPVARDRSVSPAPFPTAKIQTSKSQPSANQSVGTAASGKPATQNSGKRPKGQPKPRTKTPKLDPTSAKVTGRPNAGSKHRKMTKSKTENEQPLPQTQQQMLPPPPSMPALGTGLGIPSPDLTPIHSNNPTPEPVPTKKMRMGSSSSSNSSSSSSSGSSDSESEKEENMSHASHVISHVTQPAFPFTNAQDIQYISSQPAPQAPLNQFLPGQMPVLPSQPRPPAPIPSQMPVLPMTHQPAVKQASSSSSSSSGSDSDSSSGSSSSNSSSESSDEENGREAVPVPSRSVSQLLLDNDLHLSDSGSDSD